jgi:NADPH:quinone reductase-like Zn-dependent oxidoreductase
VPGGDVAGLVAAVGANVTRFKVGDEVFGTCDGSFAKYATTTPDRLAPKPSNLDFEHAAAVPTSAVAALQALRKGDVAAGNRVLILGAGGGVGSYAVQLAKALGAHVTGVCSTAKIDLVRSLGADDVIDYTHEDIDARGERWDVVLDGVGNRSLHRLRRVLAPRGTLVFFGGENGGRWTGGIGRWLRAMLLSPFLRQNLRVLSTVIRSEDLQALTKLIEAGDVVPAVDRTFPIADAAKAIEALRAGHVRGKVVLTP